MTAEFQQQSPIISHKKPALYIAKKKCICFMHNILKSHWKKTAWFSILKWHLTKYYQSSELLVRKSSKLLVFPAAPKITTAMLSVPCYLKVNTYRVHKLLWTFLLCAAFWGGTVSSLDGLAYLLRNKKLLQQSIWTRQRKSMGLMENNILPYHPHIFNHTIHVSLTCKPLS